MTTPTRVGIWRVDPDGGTEDFVANGRLVAPDVVLTYLPQDDAIVQQANRASSDATVGQSDAPKARLGLAAGGAEELVEVIDVASVGTQEVPDTDEVLVALELQRQSRVNAPYEVIGLPIDITDTAAARRVLEYLRDPPPDTEVKLSSEWYAQTYWYTAVRIHRDEKGNEGHEQGPTTMFPRRGR